MSQSNGGYKWESSILLTTKELESFMSAEKLGHNMETDGHLSIKLQ